MIVCIAEKPSVAKEFAKALNELGVEAKATNKKQREVEINQEISVKLNTNNEINQAPKIKMHYYQVITFTRIFLILR